MLIQLRLYQNGEISKIYTKVKETYQLSSIFNATFLSLLGFFLK